MPQDKRAGSTAVVALIRDRMLHVAWLGDSQAMLFRRGKGIELVNPHKPDREVCPLPVACLTNFALVAIFSG